MAGKRRSRGRRERTTQNKANTNSNNSSNTSDTSENIGDNNNIKDTRMLEHVKILDKMDSNNNSDSSHSEQINQVVNTVESANEHVVGDVAEKIIENTMANDVEDDVSNSVENIKRTIFITVGTTKFDKLINKILDQEIIKALNELNYTNLVMQTGMSEYNYKKGECLQLDDGNRACDNGDNTVLQNNIKTEIYDYKQSIIDDIELADLVVGHAGAGTCLEVLRKHKKLLVVTNEDLMDNHQSELARQLSEDKYLMSCNVNNLKESIIKISRQDVKFSVFPRQNLNRMAKILEDVLSA